MTQTEKVIFEKEELKITNLEVIYGNGHDSVPVADITAVEVKKRSGSAAAGCALLVLGALILWFVFTTEGFGSGCEIIPGVMLLGGAMMFAMNGSDSFQVSIHRGEKVTGIYAAKNEELAREIEAALNTAIQPASGRRTSEKVKP